MLRTVKLPYGKRFLDLELDEKRFDVTTVVQKHSPALNQKYDIFLKNASRPIKTMPLSEIAGAKGKSSPSVVIVIADHTRPVPDRLLVPWIVENLGVQDAAVTVLVGTGTHRPPTEEELNRMLGPENIKRFQIVCHDCRDRDMLILKGKSKCGGHCLLNRIYCEADIKIATGFIEPHFFAGFSGGTKAIVPGIAGLDTIMHFHRPDLIAQPNVTWGKTVQNPLLDLTREMVSFCPPDCIVNVSMNAEREITNIFIGDVLAAHDEGCVHVARESGIEVPRKFPVVLTTNSGYPLDMNFYQTVKGISAAARITQKGGSIIVASECSRGIPEGGAFEKILAEPVSSETLLREIMAGKKACCDQWQVQVLLRIVKSYNVFLYSSLNPEQQKKTRVFNVKDIQLKMEELRKYAGQEKMPVAVLPRGPLTVAHHASISGEKASRNWPE